MLSRRIPELDGIRGLAILLVVIWHYLSVPLAQSSYPGLHFLGHATILTWSGVDLFFVLSGFLIGGILIDARDSATYFSTFYIRRAFRILPLYIVACCAYFPLSAWVSHAFHGGQLGAMPWISYATFTQNFWLRNDRWHVFLAQTWSLAIEEQFYLTLPLLIWFVPAKQLWKVALVGVFAVLAFRSFVYLHFYPQGQTAAYVLLPCRADGLLLGVLAAIAVRNQAALDFIRAQRHWLYSVAGLLFLALMVCTIKGWGVMGRVMSTIGYTGLAVFYLALLLFTITSNGILKRVFSWACLRWLGTIAYGLYLIHVPALDFVFHLFGRRVPTIARALDLVPLTIALGASLLLAYLSWTLFESRLVKIGHRFTYEAPPAFRRSPLPSAPGSPSTSPVPY
ncbi:MAG: acyltransferase [Terriglobales bacterium]